jgi:hypothetical protein
LTLLVIVHDQGRELRRLAHAWAAAVFERDAGAAAALLPTATAAAAASWVMGQQSGGVV